ncbi:MAG: High-affinity branched-chain amino acid transport system permease protein LivH [Acidimicrobiales bacterium]|nr:MAG: branched-chain amino acid ABC transporter permease [Actinomycetota bacterium]MBV6509652.1 High-affinity branched-chain amino acid transport system permease protein LivH [Acidimicrobiales bacterium]RIK06344.1 MAG: branched-chain amino acid ABC transporter permease [Acidobacteriota bacterium]
MELFLQRLIDGLAVGAIYASLALGLVIIYRSSGLINFAQGEMAMFTTYLAWMLVDNGLSVWLATSAAMVFGFVLGVLVERLLIAQFSGPKESPLAIVIVTIGLFLFFNGLAPWIWGTEGKSFPNLFGTGSVDLGGVTIKVQTLGIVGVLLAEVVLFYLMFQHTKLGLSLRAVASNRESSRLVGLRVGSILAVGWGIAAMVGALSGTFVASRIDLTQNLMQVVLIYAFAAATLGGFDSPVGAVVGGIIIGVVEQMAQYVDLFDGFTLLPVFLLILVVLLVRPQGLFGRAEVSRV